VFTHNWLECVNDFILQKVFRKRADQDIILENFINRAAPIRGGSVPYLLRFREESSQKPEEEMRS
jgi:hypothetical protein